MKKVLIVIDLNSRDVRKLLYILTILLRFLHHHRLVRTPCRKDLNAEWIVLDLLMILKSVCRIISRADHLHLELLHKFLTSELGCLKLGRTLVIDFSCGLRLKDLINIEHSRELQMSPMIEWVTHCIWNSLGPFLKLCISVSLACYEFFRNSITTHRSPFIMVTTKPNLSKVGKLIVISYHLWNKVTMVVNNRLIFCA